jgi:hypothetical protein
VVFDSLDIQVLLFDHTFAFELLCIPLFGYSLVKLFLQPLWQRSVGLYIASLLDAFKCKFQCKISIPVKRLSSCAISRCYMSSCHAASSYSTLYERTV